MRKSKSLFSQLYKKAIFYGLVDEGGWFPQMLASRKTTAEHTKLAKISAISACSVAKNSVNPCSSVKSVVKFLRVLVPSWQKLQSKP